MGLGAFEKAVTDILGKTEAAALLSSLVTAVDRAKTGASTSSKDQRGAGLSQGRGRAGGLRGGRGGEGKAGGAGGRPSIREQMMAAKRKQEEDKRAAGAGKGGQGGRGDSSGGSGSDVGFVVVT